MLQQTTDIIKSSTPCEYRGEIEKRIKETTAICRKPSFLLQIHYS